MNEVPVMYISNYIPGATGVFEALKKDLQFERRENTPRSEYYINKLGDIPYTYGNGAGRRTYMPKPSHPEIDKMFDKMRHAFDSYDVCFLNYYLNQKDQLGWHADNSPEMDDTRSIAVISLGVEREIWFCPNTDKTQVTKQKLENGSLCIMKAGMQDTHLHRIPKASFLCGERISLTFRGYV